MISTTTSRIPVSISRSSSVLSDISNSVAANGKGRDSATSEAGKENGEAKGKINGEQCLSDIGTIDY